MLRTHFAISLALLGHWSAATKSLPVQSGCACSWSHVLRCLSTFPHRSTRCSTVSRSVHQQVQSGEATSGTCCLKRKSFSLIFPVRAWVSTELSALYRPLCLRKASFVKRGSSAACSHRVGRFPLALSYSPYQRRRQAWSAAALGLVSPGAHISAHVASVTSSRYFPSVSFGGRPLLWHNIPRPQLRSAV